MRRRRGPEETTSSTRSRSPGPPAVTRPARPSASVARRTRPACGCRSSPELAPQGFDGVVGLRLGPVPPPFDWVTRWLLVPDFPEFPEFPEVPEFPEFPELPDFAEVPEFPEFPEFPVGAGPPELTQ